MAKLDFIKMSDSGRSGFLEKFDKELIAGPGSYDPSYKQIDNQRIVHLSKHKRPMSTTTVHSDQIFKQTIMPDVGPGTYTPKKMSHGYEPPRISTLDRYRYKSANWNTVLTREGGIAKTLELGPGQYYRGCEKFERCKSAQIKINASARNLFPVTQQEKVNERLKLAKTVTPDGGFYQNGIHRRAKSQNSCNGIQINGSLRNINLNANFSRSVAEGVGIPAPNRYNIKGTDRFGRAYIKGGNWGRSNTDRGLDPIGKTFGIKKMGTQSRLMIIGGSQCISYK